jgi:hypothetical protein
MGLDNSYKKYIIKSVFLTRRRKMSINRVSLRSLIPFPSYASLVFGIVFLSMCPHIGAQTVNLSGQLVAEDSLQPLSRVMIVATSLTRPPTVIETLTGSDGRFSFAATAGYPYRLCSGPTGNYADSCKFSKSIVVTASADMPAIRMTAPAGIRMRVRIVDADGLLRSPQADPLVLHVFAEEKTTRTRIPLQVVSSASLSHAVEASVVIPTSMSWNIAMSSIRGQLFDASGNAYQSDTAIPRPAGDVGNEFLAIFSLRAK